MRRGLNNRRQRDAREGAGVAAVRVRHGASRWARETAPQSEGLARVDADQSRSLKAAPIADGISSGSPIQRHVHSLFRCGQVYNSLWQGLLREGPLHLKRREYASWRSGRFAPAAVSLPLDDHSRPWRDGAGASRIGGSNRRNNHPILLFADTPLHPPGHAKHVSLGLGLLSGGGLESLWTWTEKLEQRRGKASPRWPGRESRVE